MDVRRPRPLGRAAARCYAPRALDVSGVQGHRTLGTAISVAFSTRGDRGSHLQGIARRPNASPAWSRSALPRIRHMHFAGVRPPFQPYLRLLDRLRTAGITTSLDIGWNPMSTQPWIPADREADDDLHAVAAGGPVLHRRAHPGEAVRALAELVPTPVIKLAPRGP